MCRSSGLVVIYARPRQSDVDRAVDGMVLWSARCPTKNRLKRNMLLCQQVEWCRTVCSMGPCCLALLGWLEQSPTLLEMTVDGSPHSCNLLPIGKLPAGATTSQRTTCATGVYTVARLRACAAAGWNQHGAMAHRRGSLTGPPLWRTLSKRTVSVAAAAFLTHW